MKCLFYCVCGAHCLLPSTKRSRLPPVEALRIQKRWNRESQNIFMIQYASYWAEQGIVYTAVVAANDMNSRKAVRQEAEGCYLRLSSYDFFARFQAIVSDIIDMRTFEYSYRS